MRNETRAVTLEDMVSTEPVEGSTTQYRDCHPAEPQGESGPLHLRVKLIAEHFQGSSQTVAFGGCTLARCLFTAAQSVPKGFFAYSVLGIFVGVGLF